MADHLTRSQSPAFKIRQRPTVLKPAPTRPFNPAGQPVRNSSIGGNPQRIIRGK